MEPAVCDEVRGGAEMSDVEREIEVEEAEAVAEAAESTTVSDALDSRADVAEEPEAAVVSREEIRRNMATNMREKAARLKG
jgi:vacuolar-type H+-ATPase subunit C/Vma6